MSVEAQVDARLLTFEEVETQVLSLQAPSKEVRRMNLEFIARLGMPRQLQRMLDDVLTDDHRLATTAGRSYRHVNHFDKVVLVDSGQLDDYRLTLHLWIPPYSVDEHEDEMIHDHRFSFWSTILVGTLESVNFERSADGEPYRKYRYRPVKVDEATIENSYEFGGNSPLEMVERKKEAPGGSYYMRYVQIHRVLLPHQEMTCTLVLRGPRERNFANVYNTSYPLQDVRASNEMFSPTQLRNKLGALRAEMVAKRAAPR